MGDRLEVDTADRQQVWRFRCPNGHTSWSPTNAHWWCRACARAAEQGAPIDPEFDALVDQATDRRIGRDELTVTGPRAVTHG